MTRIKDKMLSVMKRIIYSEGMTPLPWNVTLPAFLLLLLNCMTMSMVFSFLPKLVKSFGYSEIETGFQVGLIGSSMFIARIPFSIIWGYCADKYGRKKLTIIASVSLMISTFAFGFSTSVTWAMITRLLQGVAMGIIIIGKALVTEVSDDTNASLAMSFVLGGFSVGNILGPVIGGFLAFPHDLYPSTFSEDSVFAKYPIVLPNGIIALGLLLGTIGSVLYMPRDKPKVKQRKIQLENEEANTDLIYSKKDNEETHLLDTQIYKNNSVTSYNVKIVKYDYFNLQESKKKSSFCFKESAFGRLIFNKGCVMTVLLYGLHGYTGIGYNEDFNLYAATSKEYHGYGFNPSEIGTALMITSVIILITQFTVMQRLVNSFGSIKCYQYCSLAVGILTPLTPLCQKIENKYWFWLTMMVSLVINKFFNVLAFLSINVMLNNSVEPDLVGFVNGLGMTVSTVGRAIAVFSIGSMFGWSLTNVKDVATNDNPLGFPFDQYFTFFFLSLVSFGISIYSVFLPKTLDKKLVVNNFCK